MNHRHIRDGEKSKQSDNNRNRNYRTLNRDGWPGHQWRLGVVGSSLQHSSVCWQAQSPLLRTRSSASATKQRCSPGFAVSSAAKPRQFAGSNFGNYLMMCHSQNCAILMRENFPNVWQVIYTSAKGTNVWLRLPLVVIKGPFTLTSFLVPVAGASFWCQLPADE